jgi:hypothetical protein
VSIDRIGELVDYDLAKLVDAAGAAAHPVR